MASSAAPIIPTASEVTSQAASAEQPIPGVPTTEIPTSSS